MFAEWRGQVRQETVSTSAVQHDRAPDETWRVRSRWRWLLHGPVSPGEASSSQQSSCSPTFRDATRTQLSRSNRYYKAFFEQCTGPWKHFWALFLFVVIGFMISHAVVVVIIATFNSKATPERPWSYQVTGVNWYRSILDWKGKAHVKDFISGSWNLQHH